MSVGARISYVDLLARHKYIRVPLIQRDYAQGRQNEIEVRNDFLVALEAALRKPVDDPSLPLNLDFIYGSVEGNREPAFLPLDGQQRLTTLFLMHWYFAWTDGRWEDFASLFRSHGRSRFTYHVRPSSIEFFDALVVFQPDAPPSAVNDLVGLICDQSWYFRSWRLDPTIQSVLGMLEAIHQRFSKAGGLFSRLVDKQRPAVTFQLLDLDNFGLSDDLYIKMNARGKPLTVFEIFKARYEDELKTQFPDDVFWSDGERFDAQEYVSRRFDTVWADFFWTYRDRKTQLYDDALMNLLRAVALVSRSPEHSGYANDVGMLRKSAQGPSYADFHSHGWLDARFTWTLVRLLDAWSAVPATSATLLLSKRYFDERSILHEIIVRGGNLNYEDVIRFSAYVGFVRENHATIDTDSFHKWMRVVGNLSANTGYNSVEHLRRSMASIDTLLHAATRIESYLADAQNPVVGFSEQQIAEERLKARLLIADEAWRGLVDRAESHRYFRGQIGFLLTFAEIVEQARFSDPRQWTFEHHKEMQVRFERFLRMAEAMFVEKGLSDPGQLLWQRALLSIGDYLLPSGRNFSFLSNSLTDEATWKRFLRAGSPAIDEKRDLLRQLWSRMSPDDPIDRQLDQIIIDAKEMEDWRAVLVRHPEAIAYCENHCIRREDDRPIYLLRRKQLNGYHAELFTYGLFLRLRARPEGFKTISPNYDEPYDSMNEPQIYGEAEVAGRGIVSYSVEFGNGSFVVEAKASGEGVAELAFVLRSLGFEEGEAAFHMSVALALAEPLLLKLDDELATIALERIS